MAQKLFLLPCMHHVCDICLEGVCFCGQSTEGREEINLIPDATLTNLNTDAMINFVKHLSIVIDNVRAYETAIENTKKIINENNKCMNDVRDEILYINQYNAEILLDEIKQNKKYGDMMLEELETGLVRNVSAQILLLRQMYDRNYIISEKITGVDDPKIIISDYYSKYQRYNNYTLKCNGSLPGLQPIFWYITDCVDEEHGKYDCYFNPFTYDYVDCSETTYNTLTYKISKSKDCAEPCSHYLDINLNEYYYVYQVLFDKENTYIIIATTTIFVIYVLDSNTHDVKHIKSIDEFDRINDICMRWRDLMPLLADMTDF